MVPPRPRGPVQRVARAIARIVAGGRSLWIGILHRDRVEAEIQEEMAHHIELRAEHLMREGIPDEEAARRARLEFGHTETHLDDARQSRGLHFLDQIRFSWLDFKLAFRMLIRYPGLTVMSVFAMTAGIAFGAGFMEFTSQWATPDLDFDPDHRMVGVVVDDAGTRSRDSRLLHDFVEWQGEPGTEGLRSMDEVGAIRLVNRNLDVGGGGAGDSGLARPVMVTEISASAFRLTETPALHGRTLVEEDERPGSSPVVVLGYDLWQDRFGGEADMVGRTVRLGGTATTVVGIMPEGYGFPRAQSLWAPFRLRPVDFPVGESPSVYVFGRLAPGVSLEQAEAEIASRGLRIAGAPAPASADAFPGVSDLGERLSARVVPFPELVYQPVPGFFDPAFIQVNLFVLALALLFCANVALLLFARAASRESELLVRNALGAGRYRIVVQLFSEALVLGAIATILGLVGARYGFEWFLTAIEEGEGSSFLPFWFTPEISILTAVYAALLTLLGAAVAGVLPALKVTLGLASRLRSQSARGGGLTFGGVWTVIIVAQIAVTVPFPAFAYLAVSEVVGEDVPDVAFVPEEYLTARIAVERDQESSSFEVDGPEISPAQDATADASFLERYAETLDELERRLVEEPTVTGVTYASRAPLAYHPSLQVEVDAPMAPVPEDREVHEVARSEVEPGFFEIMEGEILTGRALDSQDVVSEARVVVVDRTFAEQVLGGRDPVGLRLRYPDALERSASTPTEPWYEIVGMVENLGASGSRGGAYHPAARGQVYPASILVQVRGAPVDLAPQLRAIAAEIGPTVRVEGLRFLDDPPGDDTGLYAWGLTAIIILTVIALMLSLAGIYSVMSFTVSRRTREIGIRVALGASRKRLVTAIFRRPLIQVAIGIVLGAYLLIEVGEFLFIQERLTPEQLVVVAINTIFMAAVCMLAYIVPTRRALAVEPVEALNVQG